MAMNTMMEKLIDASLVADRVIYLAGALSGDSLPDDLEAFFNDEDDETIEKCLGTIPEWVDVDANGYSLAESVSSWLSDENKLGFLVRVTTPVMKPLKGGIRTYSWSSFYLTWVYAETMDGALEQGLAWAEKRRAYEDKKAGIEKGVKGKKEATA